MEKTIRGADGRTALERAVECLLVVIGVKIPDGPPDVRLSHVRDRSRMFLAAGFDFCKGMTEDELVEAVVERLRDTDCPVEMKS